MARRMIHMPADTDLNHLFEVWSEGERILLKHGLKARGWKIVFDNTKQRGGQCRYPSKEVGISAHLFAVWTYEHCLQTMLHEIAHALCPGHGHDKEWRAKAKELGHTGQRCWNPKERNSFPRKKHTRNWIGTCPNGHTITRARAPKKGAQYSCGECRPGVFDPRYIRTWSKK